MCKSKYFNSLGNSLLILILAGAGAVGCKETPHVENLQQPVAMAKLSTMQPLVVPEETIQAPKFQVTHQESGLATIVVDKATSTIALERLIWELREAAHDRSLNSYKISQSLVDERDPTFAFQIYKGTKCSSENRTHGAVMCGTKMHDAASYTYGSFAGKETDSAVIYHGPEETDGEMLFGPGSPAPGTFQELLATTRSVDQAPVQTSSKDALVNTFENSVWAGGRRADFRASDVGAELEIKADWLVSSDNARLMKLGLLSRKSEICAAGFKRVRMRAFGDDKGEEIIVPCK